MVVYKLLRELESMDAFTQFSVTSMPVPCVLMIFRDVKCNTFPFIEPS
jgi:hypothetical protein